jgi:hypothetical protein
LLLLLLLLPLSGPLTADQSQGRVMPESLNCELPSAIWEGYCFHF